MRIVIALGGNALLRRSDPMTTEGQRRNIAVDGVYTGWGTPPRRLGRVAPA